MEKSNKQNFSSSNFPLRLFSGQKHEVQGIAYDITTTTLFWTDGNGHAIWKRSLIDESNSPELLLDLKDEIPMGIAVSYCQR